MRSFTKSISGWDLHDTVYSRELLISNSANGYRDLIADIDLSTLRYVPWEKNVPFFLVSFLDPETKAPVSVCPRGLLKKIEAKAEQSGWQCLAGVEFEACISDASDLDFTLNSYCSIFNLKVTRVEPMQGNAC